MDNHNNKKNRVKSLNLRLFLFFRSNQIRTRQIRKRITKEIQNNNIAKRKKKIKKKLVDAQNQNT